MADVWKQTLTESVSDFGWIKKTSTYQKGFDEAAVASSTSFWSSFN